MRRSLMCVLSVLTATPVTAQILNVHELNTAQIQALDKSRTAVLLPGGILEEHGPYLPSFSDGYQSDFMTSKVADAIAARPGWTVLKFPALPLGASPASEIGSKYSFPGSYPVRMATLRAVYMDLASDLGDAGFKWVFVINLHGAPTHARAIDEASRFFDDTFGGRMVQLSGLNQVAGAVPKDLFTAEQKRAEGFSVHADADEHSRILFLRPDLVASGIQTAPPIVGRSMPDLITIAKRDGWTGYFGTPAIATTAAGARAMNALAEAAAKIALQVLDGNSDAALARVGDAIDDPNFKPVVDPSLAHERDIERRENDWLAKQRRQ